MAECEHRITQRGLWAGEIDEALDVVGVQERTEREMPRAQLRRARKQPDVELVGQPCVDDRKDQRPERTALLVREQDIAAGICERRSEPKMKCRLPWRSCLPAVEFLHADTITDRISVAERILA